MKGINFILKGVAKKLNIQALKEFGQICFYNEVNLYLYCFSLPYRTLLKIAKEDYVVLINDVRHGGKC